MKSTIIIHRIFRSIFMLYETFKTLIIRFVIICQKTISKCITFVNKPVRKCKHCSMVGMRSNQVSHWIGWFFPGKSSPARFTASSSLQIRKLPILIKEISLIWSSIFDINLYNLFSDMKKSIFLYQELFLLH